MGYLNLADIQKFTKKELKNKCGIYGFICKSNNKLYLGSSIKLATLFNKHIKGFQSNILLQRVINKYNLQGFIFVVFEYCEAENLISREEFYFDKIKPEYNRLKIAGSSLGFKHTEESLSKLSETHKGKTGENSPNFGKSLFEETKALMSLAKSGENPYNFGKILSAETKAKMSLALSGENHPMFGKIYSTESKDKISANNGTSIFVYSKDGLTLINSFSSATKAGEYFNVSYHTILKYTKSGKLFKNEGVISTSLISKE